MLYDTYRPKCWAELVGQPKAVATARRIIDRDGFDRGAFWIEAAGEHNSGLGKSSLAHLIAAQLQPNPFFVLEIPGRKLDLRAVDGIEADCRLSTWNGHYRVWIVDEAHAITQGAVDALLPLLEALPARTCLIFTTTRTVDAGLFGDDCGPFASRTHRIKLTNQGIAEPMAARLQEIALAENLDGKPHSAYLRLVRENNNNMRACLQRIEAGDMLA